MMSRWTLASGWDDLFWPQLLRGVTMAMLFIPLSTTGLRSLPSSEIAKGSGMYNLFRQLGGSFGIAVIATILDRRTDVHRHALAGQVGPFADPTLHRIDALSQHLVGGGLDPSQASVVARAALERLLEQAASMQAFYDAYFAIGVSFLIALPGAFLIARHAPGKYTRIE
jgi:DHA2 family multidrug resistance protein